MVAFAAGPLAPHVPGFSAELKAQGYKPDRTKYLVRIMGSVGRWLERCRMGPEALTSQRVQLFRRARRRAGAKVVSELGLDPLLSYLRKVGVVPKPCAPAPMTSRDRLLARYRDYLVRERSLVPSTVRMRMRVAHRFLSPRWPSGEPQPKRLTACDVNEFVLRTCRRSSVGYARLIVGALRSLLRFLFLEGLTPTPLTGAAPAVAGWSLSSLPQGLEPTEVARALRTCDRRSALGLRNYAILVLLLRLALRAGEVAAIQLDDIDWCRGEIVIRGKGASQERLPLPADVGEALVRLCRYLHTRAGLFIRGERLLATQLSRLLCGSSGHRQTAAESRGAVATSWRARAYYAVVG